MENKTNNVINLNDTFKIKCLHDANNTLHINNSLNKIIFVYSKPKVGSTSLVTSLRLFALNTFNIIHIHDDEMLKVLGNIRGVTVNEIILYNKMIGKDVYVIDIYRSPIERKISTFFEKINTFHYNIDVERLSKYNIENIIERFNKIFPYIGNGDNFLDIYNINYPEQFPYDKKYIAMEENGIKYIKLRLKDSHLWENILQDELKINIKIVRDYETTSKPVKIIYNLFKQFYKIPDNYLGELANCAYLNYYYSPEEKLEYLNDWVVKKNEINFISFTPEEFKLYEYVCRENSNNVAIVQVNHYLDEGCKCKACQIKRNSVVHNIIQGETILERIFHEEAKNELLEKRIKAFNTFSKKISLPPRMKNRVTNMKNIVALR